MKQLITLLFTLFISATLSAQMVIDPDIILFDVEEEMYEVKIDVTNNTDEFTEIYWEFEPAENYPEEWSMTICDARTCYSANTFKSSIDLPNLLDPGQTMLFKFTITPNGVEGSSFGILHLFDDTKFENEVGTSKAPITSVSDKVYESLVIYPNPASEYFEIKNDAQVKSLEVASITGQILLSENHTEGKTHSISDLAKGVYFVVLRDGNDDKVKTLRLIK